MGIFDGDSMDMHILAVVMLKRVKINSAIALLISMALISCRYEEGPKISLRSVHNRLDGQWRIQSVEKNNADETNNYKSVFVDYQLEIKKDGEYTLSYRPLNQGTYTENGAWVTAKDKKTITLTQQTGANPGSKSTWLIIRLSKDEFWAKYTDPQGDQLFVKLKS